MHAFLSTNHQLPAASPDTLHIHPDPTIGIDAVRQINRFLARKPISGKSTVVIHQADLLTLPAQNALLKTLEEPPGNSLIHLVTQYPDILLPTIISRVQIISSPLSLPAPHPLIPRLLSLTTVGDRLALLSSPSFTRESFSAFLDHFEHYLHHEITAAVPPLESRGRRKGELYKLIVESRKYLKSNCHLKLLTTHLALHL